MKKFKKFLFYSLEHHFDKLIIFGSSSVPMLSWSNSSIVLENLFLEVPTLDTSLGEKVSSKGAKPFGYLFYSKLVTLEGSRISSLRKERIVSSSSKICQDSSLSGRCGLYKVTTRQSGVLAISNLSGLATYMANPLAIMFTF